MRNPVAVVRTGPETKNLLFWCPGCDDTHMISFEGTQGSTWTVWDWDRNLEAPTVSPSILVRYPTPEPDPRNICHSFLRAGRWEFLGDCTHALAGQTVGMVPLPDWLVREAD